MRAADQFHIGIVVDDLDASLDQFSDLFGFEWCDEVHVEQPVLLPDGVAPIEFRFRYSRNAPRVEVIQAQPGTLWMPAAGSGIHHLGYWSDDVAGDGATLEQAGFALEAASADTGGDHGGVRYWAYHRSASGPRIELVSRALEPMLSQMWSRPA